MNRFYRILSTFGTPEFGEQFDRFLAETKGQWHFPHTFHLEAVAWMDDGFSLASFPGSVVNEVAIGWPHYNALKTLLEKRFVTFDFVTGIRNPPLIFHHMLVALTTGGRELPAFFGLKKLFYDTRGLSQMYFSVREVKTKANATTDKMIRKAIDLATDGLENIRLHLELLEILETVQYERYPLYPVRERLLLLRVLLGTFLENRAVLEMPAWTGPVQEHVAVEPGTKCLHEGCKANARPSKGFCKRHCCKRENCGRPIVCPTHRIFDEHHGVDRCTLFCDRHYLVIHDRDAFQRCFSPLVQFFGPLPDHWSPDTHWLMFSERRKTIRTVLMASREPASPVSKLPTVLLHELFRFI